MVYGYWIYDGRCPMFGTMFLGVGSPLNLAMVDGIKCENRGSDMHLLHILNACHSYPTSKPPASLSPRICFFYSG
jgi:hypothetical protein